MHFNFHTLHICIIYCSEGLTQVLEYLYLVNEHKLYQDSISRKLHILVLNYAYTVSFTERRKQDKESCTYTDTCTYTHTVDLHRETQMHKHNITHKYNNKPVIS